MLTGITIKNIAVIEHAEIQFERGFNVLTGETAAGKSIIIDSVNMVLGGRTGRDLIRNGTDKAVVEAVFHTTRTDLPSDEGMIIVRRELFADGRNVCKINGESVTVTALREFGENLINIHGQHDNQALLNPARHMDLLDEFAGVELEKSDYKAAYAVQKDLEKRLASLSLDESEKAKRLDMLTFQLNEITAVNPQLGEDEVLRQEREVLANSAEISEALAGSYDVLYDGEGAALEKLAKAVSFLNSAAKHEHRLEKVSERLEESRIIIDDIARELSDYIQKIEHNPHSLDAIESRLHAIFGLKKKYGSEISEILKYKEEIQSEIDSIEGCEEEVKELQNKIESNAKIVAEKAAILTGKRKLAANELQEKIVGELVDLEMHKVRFEVAINSVDNAEFLISTNIGEPLRPLVKIASGGELSRIMLAIKSILADSEATETLIFDEIDAGISGRAAQKTAEKLAAIGRHKQILCITHLAQIAGMASTHFQIKKDTAGERTFTNVLKLDKEGRRQELARIIGGAQITELTLKNAEEMLELAGSVHA